MEKMEKFDKDFRVRYLFFLKELQNKKPKGKSLEFHLDPYDTDSGESTHYLSSKGIRKRGERKYITPERLVYGYNASHEQIIESLKCLQGEVDKHKIEVD